MRRMIAALGVWLMGAGLAGSALAASPEEMERRLEQLQKEVQELKKQLQQRAPEAPQPAVPAEPAGIPAERYSLLGEAVRLGGYGSVRFEANDLDEARDTFTFRRFVLTADARIAEPLRFGFELEFERFTELELEREIEPEAGGLTVEQAVEGSSETELSVEQAWLEYELAPPFRFRAGQVLVPLGRFNLNHDDNRWNLPRRSLIDRGIPVLPAAAAWPELGMGFTGDAALNGAGSLSYQLYVVNGVVLDAEVEEVIQTRDPRRDKLEIEAELRPTRGTAGIDLKDAKAVTGRLAWSPVPGREIGGSFYAGRYTPEFLASETLVGFGGDGLFTLGPFEAEAQYLYTHFGNVPGVARSFARVVRDRAVFTPSSTDPNFETEVEFELADLVSTKQGYWIELRYRLFPEWLRQSIFGRRFRNPQLIPTVRWEQAWLDGVVRELDFRGGELTALEREDRWINRITAGLAYRPTPLVVFQAAYEFTWTDNGKSLADVTNFLPARAGEDEAHAFLFGVAFGF